MPGLSYSLYHKAQILYIVPSQDSPTLYQYHPTHVSAPSYEEQNYIKFNIKSPNSNFLFHIKKDCFLELSNVLATAASGFNLRLSRAYSMIYGFLPSSKRRQHRPLPAGISPSPAMEKPLQLCGSCDSLKPICVLMVQPFSSHD
jgi:hypothetical protein